MMLVDAWTVAALTLWVLSGMLAIYTAIVYTRGDG